MLSKPVAETHPQFGSAPNETPGSDPRSKALPDKPVAKSDSDLSGDSYSRSVAPYRPPKSPIHKNESWSQAIRHPFELSLALGLVASEFFDAEATQHCLKLKACTEADPIFFSSRPSRARTYSIALPLTALGICSLGHMKQKKHGLMAELLASAMIASHMYYGIKGYRLPHR